MIQVQQLLQHFFSTVLWSPTDFTAVALLRVLAHTPPAAVMQLQQSQLTTGCTRPYVDVHGTKTFRFILNAESTSCLGLMKISTHVCVSRKAALCCVDGVLLRPCLIKKQVTVAVVVRLQLSLWLCFWSHMCVPSNATSVRGASFYIREHRFTQIIPFSLGQNDASSPARHHLSRYIFRIMLTYYEHPISVSSPVQLCMSVCIITAPKSFSYRLP